LPLFVGDGVCWWWCLLVMVFVCDGVCWWWCLLVMVFLLLTLILLLELWINRQRRRYRLSILHDEMHESI